MTLITMAKINHQESIGKTLQPALPVLLLAALPPLALSAAALLIDPPLPLMPTISVLMLTAFATVAAITKLSINLRDKQAEVTTLWQQLTASKKQVQRHASWLKNLNEMSCDWYWEMDKNFRFVVFEGKLAYENGFVSAKMIGLSPWEIPALNLTQEDWISHRATLNQHQAFQEFEICRAGRDAKTYWISVSGRPLTGDRSTFTGYAGICRVITDAKVASQKIENLALEDELTGLANRRLLLSRLPQAVSVARRHKRNVGLLLVSLDKFKRINETHGNQIGDMVIRELATRLQSGVRASDLVARYNGDVFAVLLEEMVGDQETIDADVTKLAEKLVKLVQAPITFLSTEIVCSVCIGLTVTTPQLQTTQQLINEAENALAIAKLSGGGCILSLPIRLWQPQQASLLELVDEKTPADGGRLANS
jgi:diguanylate cyclase (GGDEF)-like protein/PAS domain S-box-containing protein